jgi:hypothetical protein
MQSNHAFKTIIIFFVLSAIGWFFFGKPFGGRIAKGSDWASTSLEVLLSCGDGQLGAGEPCDYGQPPLIPPVFGGLTCSDFGYASGMLVCDINCAFIATSSCYTCGNGLREAVEECDSGDFSGKSCLNYGYNSGTLSCTGGCLVNLQNCYSTGLQGGTQPTQGGGGGGGSRGGGGTAGYEDGRDTPLPGTKVQINGKAYPDAVVNVLKESVFRGTTKADGNADFRFEDQGITPGVASYSFWSEDKNKIKSTLYTVTFQVTSNALTTVSGAYLAPTITSDKVTLKKGEEVTIFGTTIPQTKVYIEIHSEKAINEEALSDEDGEWRVILDTSRLEDNSEHTAKSFFQKVDGSALIKSGFSKTITFTLGDTIIAGECAGADLNADKRVNLTDFSILLFHWNSNNVCADQNHDGTVSLIDFSIMMFNWTG